ncbi:SGT1 protein-domain-containing protein [Crassisporium funariophilum]|nr:SGT1 protein-domain-containing protein [Crassisporium funariophilum]
MDIFNRPPSISEDTLQYAIYPPPDSSDKVSVTTFATCIISYVDALLPDHLWHRDAFEVKLVPNQDTDGTWILEGRMRVGDCVDDEWCAVWLLKEISAKWDVVISVYDSDGEFLLIEAAEALPSWVKPTNSENRVWIYNSRMHLIPLSHISPTSRKRHRRKLPGAAESDDESTGGDGVDAFLAAEDAVKLVREPLITTLAPSPVERLIWQRISGYPAAGRNHAHLATVFLPTDIAKALAVNPSLIQKAVEAFYTRDAIQLRVAHRMSRFPPNTSLLATVKMTRTAYAQLVGQKFFPPKVFGQWKELENTKEWRWRNVGMKIAVGFEMLYQESKSRSNGQNVSVEGVDSLAQANIEALRRNPEYGKYIQNLMKAGYFKGELEGSALWNEYENKAVATFLEVRRTDDATRQSFASQVDAALANSTSPPDHANLPEDSDDWLTVDAQDFDHMLEETLNNAKGNQRQETNAVDVDSLSNTESAEDRLASEQAKQLKDLAAKVEVFVEGEGDLGGAMFDDEEFSDEPFSDDEETVESESDIQDEAAESTAKQAAIDKLIPALEPSDYGKMPASYYKNSQRVTPATVADDAMDDDSSQPNAHEQQSFKAGTIPESNAQLNPARTPIIPRDKYDGVDSDDETDEEEVEDDESEEDRPQFVGDIEIDMEEEEEEFLEFSRQTLGISDEQWEAIVNDRKGRGAFLPNSATKPSVFPTKVSDKEEKTEKKTHIPRIPEPGPRPNVNPELDSFEAVMKALDEELSRSQKTNKKPSASKNKGKERQAPPSAMDVDEDGDLDVEAAMDAEIKEALQGGDSDSEEPMDYNMIKNFLESYKSQAGLSGPVSNLAGRLQPDVKLPREE